MRVFLCAIGLGVFSFAAFLPSTATAVDYYFHGMPDDQAQKGASFANGAPPPAGNLTYNQNAPSSAAPIQQSNNNPNSEFIPNPLAVWWTGEFSGTINGEIRIDWTWQTSNAEAIALGVAMNVKIVADPDFANPGEGTQTIIGDANTTFFFAGSTPTTFTTIVPVSGTVTSNLLIQAASQFTDTGTGLVALYDHATAPSKWTIPVTPTRNATWGSVKALYR